jgi:hypothetical protein
MGVQPLHSILGAHLSLFILETNGTSFELDRIVELDNRTGSSRD